MPYDKNKQYTTRPFEYWLDKAVAYQRNFLLEQQERDRKGARMGNAPLMYYPMGPPQETAKYMAFQDWFRPKGGAVDRSDMMADPSTSTGRQGVPFEMSPIGRGEQMPGESGRYNRVPFEDNYTANPDLWGLKTLLAAMRGGR